MTEITDQPQVENIDRQSIEPDLIIQVRNLSRVYSIGQNKVTALSNLSIDVPTGVLAALKGRSGSGKTTLLNIVGGLDSPTSGNIKIFDQNISDLDRTKITDLRRNRIGFIFQSYAIMPTFSAIENVELMLRISGNRRDRHEIAMRSLEIVGLGAWAHHRPWELSGGQQQRVAIARALSTSPDLILADEPTGELDSNSGRQIMALFRYIVIKEGITILMATHDPMIEEYAHVIFELEDGKIERIRNPENGF
jgi:ABC-type lipoprotein export system ATPase subunit